MKKRYFFLFALMASSLMATVTVSGCKKKAGTSTRPVRIAIQPSAAFMPLYLARYTGLMEEVLAPKQVTVVWQDFESGPPMNESLRADLSDIGVMGDVPTVGALSGIPAMKLVGVPASGANAYALLARADDSSLVSPADLRGKRVATVFGSTGHNLIKKLLEKAGLSFSDIDFRNINAAEAEEQLAGGTVDAVVIWEPTVTRLTGSGRAKIIARGSDTDLRGTNGFVVREEYLAENADVVGIILQQYARAVDMLGQLDGEALAPIAAALAIRPDQVQAIADTYDFSVVITPEDVAALQDTVSFLVSIGNLASEFPVEPTVDRSCYSR